MKAVTIHTDGACSGNPGPGGWAAVLEYAGKTKEIFGGELGTTNNQMELQGAIEALECLKEPCEVQIFTDSKYVCDGITKWIHGWKATGWKKKIKNRELWLRLDAAAARHKVAWRWVKGHAGHPMNERCDVLATAEAARIKGASTASERADALARFTQTHDSAVESASHADKSGFDPALL